MKKMAKKGKKPMKKDEMGKKDEGAK